MKLSHWECGRFWVTSETVKNKFYLVDVVDMSCSCEDHQIRGGTCKHLSAVLMWLGKKVAESMAQTEKEVLCCKGRNGSEEFQPNGQRNCGNTPKFVASS